MKGILAVGAAALLATTAFAFAQQANTPPPPPRPYFVGNPIGVPAAPPAPDAANPAAFVPMSDNVKVYGSFRAAESCSWDPDRDLIVVPNMGIAQNLTANDGFVSLINHDGSVNTPKWIGVQGANARGEANLTTPLVLNQPFGSDIMNGMLYIADTDGGTPNTDPGATGNVPTVGVIRMFDMATGEPRGSFVIDGSISFNDIEVAEDGTIYASQTGNADGSQPGRIYKINPDGTSSVFIAEGGALNRPNGVAFDPDGNIVVVNIGANDVLTYNPAGELILTEHASQSGNDGLVILDDGTKYVSSVQNGGVSKIAPGQESVLIATGIPSAASMCYDPTANNLVIPMNQNNALAFISLN
jgi:WD40 repeat protein